MTTIREQFTPEGFTDQEAEAIFLRAAELHTRRSNCIRGCRG